MGTGFPLKFTFLIHPSPYCVFVLASNCIANGCAKTTPAKVIFVMMIIIIIGSFLAIGYFTEKIANFDQIEMMKKLALTYCLCVIVRVDHMHICKCGSPHSLI